MAVSSEMQEFGRALAAEFSKSAQADRRELVLDIESLLDKKLAKLTAKIEALEKSVGSVIHEQREQKRILQNHGDRLTRGDEEFKRMREDIKAQHELTLIALQGRTSNALTVNGAQSIPGPANNVSVSNSPGVANSPGATQENSIVGRLTGPLVTLSGGAAIGYAITKLIGG